MAQKTKSKSKSSTTKTGTTKTGKKAKPPYMAKAGYKPGARYECGGKLIH